MRPSRAPSLRAGTLVVLGLAYFVSAVLAHGDEEGGMDMDMGMDMSADKPKDEYPPTYFAHPEHAALMYGHIGLMVASWVFVLPVAVMLSLVSSRYTLPTQFVFLALNAIGVLLGTIYNAQTPDLYPGNAHHSIGWIITWVVSAHVLVSLTGRVAATLRRSAGSSAGNGSGFSAAHHERSNTVSEEHHFLPVATHGGSSSGSSSPQRSAHEFRLSDDSGQASSMRSNSVSTHVGEDEDMYLAGGHKEYEDEDEEQIDLESMPFSTPKPRTALQEKMVKVTSWRFWKYIDLGYKIVDRIILPFGFVAFTTGIITYGRLFEGKQVFGGLAHWIKGGIFFWLGLFNLGRWTGSFAELGWAWNIRPKQRGNKWRPSAEFVESLLIFIYGSTNIFLEHLGKWGEEWRAQDLEHLSITVLFIGGGLCGMLIESTRIRDLLNTTVADVDVDAHALDASTDLEREQLRAPTTYSFSLNPIPALVILLLGIMMSSHHQQSMTSTMVHAQWGNLLTGASMVRGLTYVIMYIRPPQSVFPSRPPTELLAAFGLIAGGIIFMASSSDTVDGMIHYKLDAMFLYTVTMGLVGLLMAWVILVLALKGWAQRKERRAAGRPISHGR